jgi:large subunit ribosomal protein L29
MKPAEIREMTQEEIENKELELREELFNLKIQNATGQLENSARIGHIKKDIARVRTIRTARAENKGGVHAQKRI